MNIRAATQKDLVELIEIGNLCFSPEETATEKEISEHLSTYIPTIFGVNTAPKYRKRGYAAIIMDQVIADAKHQWRKGCILTCKAELVHYYEKFGYLNKGVSQSKIADEVWYDIQLTF